MYFLYCHSQDADQDDARARPWVCLWQDPWKRAILKKLSAIAVYPVPLWRRFRILHARASRGTTRVVAQGTIGDGVYAMEEHFQGRR